MFSKPEAGNVDLNKALNDLIKAGQVDPTILLKYSQNPPPEYGPQGKLIVSLAASAVARDKTATKTMEPAPTKTVAEQIDNKLVEATQPGIAGLNNQTPPMQGGINTPSPEPSLQAMNSGVANLPIDDGMYNEQNYASGGIVSFAAGDLVRDPYAAFRMPIPAIPTADDLLLETQDLKSRFVDPDFYKKRKQDLEAQTLEDIKESKQMGQADILFALAEGYGSTPGSFLRGTVAAGSKARPAVAEMNKNIIAAKRLNRAALNDLEQAKYAESIGDFKTAAALRESARTKEFEAQKVNATTGATIGAAQIKSAAALAGKEGDLNSKIYDKAQKDFAATFPSGSSSGIFRDNPGFIQFVKNIYLKNAEEYIKTNKMPAVPTQSQLMKMFEQSKNPAAKVKPASKLSGVDSPLAQTRPKNIQSILDKYPKTGSRSTNTQEELDTPWELAGQGLEDDE